MAFLEWRRFTFFDLHKNVDNGKVLECLQDTEVSVATSGNNHVVLCDTTGWCHLVSRSWDITSFKAYELSVTLAQQLPHDPYLVTIGEDEPGTNPLLRVWDWARSDRHGNPTCVRVSRAVPSHMRPTPASAMAAHDNKNLLAVGFQDGSVTMFRGDIARQRSGKMKTLVETGTSPITGLAFKGADKLFIVSRAAVMVYWLSTDRCVTLERMGAAPACSVLADKRQLMMAANQTTNQGAIYCYTTEGRGPCYALEGEKVRLDWFRSYLVITTNETPVKHEAAPGGSTDPTPKAHHVTILDIQNKFIVFSKTFEEIDAVITEWGSFYILTKRKELIYLEEKDLQSKLTLLFKKNLYDVAIRIASSQHYDAEGLTEIYKQYGDHLYAKGDLKGAIEQYVKTIGWLETSYVIRKYLESRHLEPLVIYLEELHKKGCATEDHTTLLLTCYVKIDQHDQQGKLKEFITATDRTIDFDVDVAIKVVRQVSPEDALTLAANYKRHDWCLKVLLEDKAEYRKALDYIAELEFDDAEMYLRKYGHTLLQHAPDESTRLLKLLCTDYKPRSAPLVDESSLSGHIREPERAFPDDFVHLFLSNSERLIEFLEHMVGSDVACSKLLYNALVEHYIHVCAPLVDESSLSGHIREPERAFPDDFVHLFLSNSERLIEFLEHMVGSDVACSKLLYNALVEHYIHVWAKSQSSSEKAEYEQKVLKILRDPEANYDKDQTLIICQMLAFKPGILHLYEENKLWRAQVALHMRDGDTELALGVCRRRGAACSRLWLDALWWPPPAPALPELLRVIETEKLLSPILVIDCLASTPSYTLGDVRKYLMDVLKSENDVITRERELATKYRSESEKMKSEIQTLRNEPITFQSSRCAACSRPLELPTVHFLCRHTYHQHCFQSYSESEGECPACVSQAPRRDVTPRSAETLHARLRTEHDPYAVVSEYFGRGLFNKITVLAAGGAAPDVTSPPAQPPAPAAPPPTISAPPVQTYGPGAEAKMRLHEGRSKQMYVSGPTKQMAPKGSSAVVPVPEGRMRILEQQQYSSSLEANLRQPAPAVHIPRVSPVNSKTNDSVPSSGNGSPKISSAIANASKNPFEDEEVYDDTMNPFADEEAADPTNPFGEDDYDKNLNPFS